MSPSDHSHLPGLHLGKPLLAKLHSSRTNNADAEPTPGTFANPDSVETRAMQQQLVNDAMGAGAGRAPVHVSRQGLRKEEEYLALRNIQTFDPDSTPLEKASATATGGRALGSVGKLGTTGIGVIGKIGSTGLGVVQKVGSTGVGAVTTVGSTGLGVTEQIASVGLSGVQKIGSTGIQGVQLIGSAGIGGLGTGLHGVKSVVGASGHAENDGAHSLAVDLSTMEDDVPDTVIGLDDDERGSGKAVEATSAETGDELPGEAMVKTVVGWLQSVGGTTSGNTLAELKTLNQQTQTKNIFTVILPPSFFGTAYHNAAIIIFAVLATRVLTLLRMGWAWHVILLAFCMSIYSISIERTRARARDDIARELTKTRLVDETESADWINSLLDRAWLIAEPLLSGKLCS